MSWPVKINDIKKIQIESTNYCNARCSACHREEILLGQQQPNILGINNNYISFEQFVSWFDKDDFLRGASNAYETIVTNFENGNKDALKPLLSNEVLNSFTSVKHRLPF